MSRPPEDDDYFFEDLESLDLGELDVQSLLTQQELNATTAPPPRTEPRIRTPQKPRASAAWSAQPTYSLGSNVGTLASNDLDEFEDFGNLDDVDLLLDDNDDDGNGAAGSSIYARPGAMQASTVTLERSPFFGSSTATVRPQAQHRPPPPQQLQQQRPQQPQQYFSIFSKGANAAAPANAPPKNSGKNNYQSNGNNSLQKTGPGAGGGYSNPFTGASAAQQQVYNPYQQEPRQQQQQQQQPMRPRSDPMNDFTSAIDQTPPEARRPDEPLTHHAMDKAAILTWQYPINYPTRDYQFNIIRKALFGNILVSLPTGLGKTFIAAVVMLNYFRWFPESKIVFMAPTRPLVNQQIEACYRVCGIPQDVTVEMTGQQNAELRRTMWQEKRVIFCTPQVLHNDLNSGICPGESIVCLVIDEAHRGTGKYSYAEVIRIMDGINRDVRVLALTATPGSDIRAVQKVITNLKISAIEIRTEDSMDLQRYVFKRVIQELVIPCGREVSEIRDKFVRWMRPFLDRLAKQNVIRTTDPQQLTSFSLIQGKDSFLREHPGHSSNKSFIMKQIGVCIGLIHAYDLLTVHGIRPFFANMDPFASNSTPEERPSARGGGGRGRGRGGRCGRGGRGGRGGYDSASGRQNAMDEDDEGEEQDNVGAKDNEKQSMARQAMRSIPEFVAMMEDIRRKIKRTDFISHPKLERLVGVVVQHFVDHQDEQDALRQAGEIARAEDGDGGALEEDEPVQQQTRVMIFANYRESVEEISRVLESHRPLIKVQSFIGQASAKGKKGISQKEQQKVVADFQKGEHNVLVATSIGEEGLDIGDVDLIVCYDSHSSPIRMLQRMGRTGRKRKGKICLLLAEGPEEQRYRRSQSQYKAVQRAITTRGSLSYYMDAPRILPPKHVPACDRVHIEIPDYVTPQTGRKRRKVGDGTGTGAGASAGPSIPASIIRSAFLDAEELARFQRRYLISKRDQARARITFQDACKNMLEGRKRSTMNAATTTFRVGHSTRTLDLIKAVNRISKARVDQSLASVMDSADEDDVDGEISSGLKSDFWKSMLKDSYSKRMLAVYKSTPEYPALEELGTKSKKLTSSVAKPAKGTTTENARPNTSGLYGHLEALDDDELDSLHQGRGHGKKKLPRRPRLFSEDRDASNTGTATNSNSDTDDVSVVCPVYKRPQPQARSRRKQATVTESTSGSRTTLPSSVAVVKDHRPQRSLSPDSDSPLVRRLDGSKHEKIQSYFNVEAYRPSERPDVGDKVADRTVMDGFDFDYEFDDVQEPDQDWMPMASDPVNDDRVPGGEDMGFDFNEPSTPPQWYNSGSPTDSPHPPGKGLNQDNISSASNHTLQGSGHSTQQKRKRLLSVDEDDAWHDPFALLQSGTVQLLALPPVPESGKWYRKTEVRFFDRPSIEIMESDEDDLPTELFEENSASTNSKADRQDAKDAVNNVLERTKEDDDIELNDIMFIESSQEETAPPPPLPRQGVRSWEQRRPLQFQEERYQHTHHPSAKSSVRDSENSSYSRSKSSNHYSSFMSARDLHLGKSDSAAQQSSKSPENREELKNNGNGSSSSSSSKPAQAISKAPNLKSLWGDPEEDSFEDDEEPW